MRAILAAIFALAATAAQASDDDIAPGRHHGRAFWLSDPNRPGAVYKTDAAPQSQFTLTYTDGLARRLGVVDGHADFLDGILNDPDVPGPKFVGSVDGGGAKILLRWHPGE